MSEVSFLPPFISARGMLKPLCVLLVITAAVSWTSVGVDWALLSLADEVRSGLEVSRSDRLAHTKTADLLGNIQLACVLLTGGLFMAWLYQIRVNARALGCRRLRWRREWTIVGFLIPFLNALRPYQVMREVWKASDPDTADPLEWRKQRVPHILTLWWIAFVAFGVCELVSSTVLLGIDTAGERRLAYSLATMADLFAGVGASLAYFVAHRLTNAQDEKYARHGRPAESLDLAPEDALA